MLAGGYRSKVVYRRFDFVAIPLILPPHWTFHGSLPIPLPKTVTNQTGLPLDKVGLRFSGISRYLSSALRSIVFPLRLLKVPETFRVKIVQGNAVTTMNRNEILKGRALPGMMRPRLRKNKKLPVFHGASLLDAVTRKGLFRRR